MLKWSQKLSLMLCCILLPQNMMAIERKSYMSHDHDSVLTYAGDFFSNAMPAIAIMGGLYQHQYEKAGFDKALFPLATVAAMGAATMQLKWAFRHTELGIRPNGYHDSFPSGHTSSAFCGALLIHKMFGIRYGVPAYALATMTAYSRIDGHYHHFRDVVAGSLLALSIHLVSEHFFDSKSLGLNQKYDIALTPAYQHGLKLEWRF